MTITAKYHSRCTSCQAAIQPGQQIEWTKGQPPKHTVCGAISSLGKCDKCGGRCNAGYTTCYRCSGHRTSRPGTRYERGVGVTCDECGERAVRGTRCWETGAQH